MRTSSVSARGIVWGASAAILGLLLALLPFAWSQSKNTTPVEQLRHALKASYREVADRDRAVKAALAQLRTLGDLGRALSLSEWRETRADDQSTVDPANRATLQERFTEAMHDVLHRADPGSTSVAFELLLELSKASKDMVDSSNLSSVFAPDVARIISAGPATLRADAAVTLGQIEPDVALAVPVLATLIKDTDPANRRAAATGLKLLLTGIVESSSRRTAKTSERTGRAIAVQAACGAMQATRASLVDPTPAIRLESVQIAMISATILDTFIVEAPSEEQADAQEHKAALEVALGEAAETKPLAIALGEISAVLAGRLLDGNREVRLHAYKAYSQLGHARWRWLKQNSGLGLGAEDPLMEGMSHGLAALNNSPADPDVVIRRLAMEVLELFGPAAAPAVPGLTKALEDNDHFVRWIAVRTLGNLGPLARAAIPSLTKSLADSDLDVRLAAAAALERVSAPTTATTKHQPVQWASDTTPATASNAQLTMTALIESLQARDAVMRLAALKTIRGMGADGKPALRALTVALHDEDERVRKAAAETLGSLGPIAREASEALKLALTDKSPEVRQAAGDALLSVSR